MAFQFSTTVRNAWLDQIETTIGTSAILRIRSGAAPAACGDADTGTVLAEMTLPSDWMANATGGSKSISGTWQDLSANASGTAGHFRVYDSGGTTCHIQGSVNTSAADMIVQNTSIASGQQITVTAFTLNAGGA